jgi:transposase
MKRFRECTSRNQLSLLPRSIEEYVPEGDLVRYVDMLVEEFDLSRIESRYSHTGRPAYNPRVIVKLWVYAKLRNISSSRELSQAARENLRFMYLAQNERPDFRTLSEFRKQHQGELAALLTQTVAIGMRENLITLDYVAVDGTKLLGSAGRNSFKTPAQLKEELEQLEAELRDSFAEDIRRDEEEDAKHGDNDGETRLPKELHNKKALREKLKKAIKHHEQIEGEKPRKVSVTDPECRFMQGKGINPSYNAQLAVDGKSLMAVGGYTVTACCDSSQLEPLMDEIKVQTGLVPKVVAADRGYSYKPALKMLEQRGIDGYVSLCDYRKKQPIKSFRYDETQDSYICADGRALPLHQMDRKGRLKRYRSLSCEGCKLISHCMPRHVPGQRRLLCVSLFEQYFERMKQKTQTELGRTFLKRRSATVEPVFGTIKQAMRFRQLNIRGSTFVNAMWRFHLATYNIAKLARFFQMQALSTA